MGMKKHKGTEGDNLQPIGDKAAMKMIARGAPANGSRGLRHQLRADKRFALELGALVEGGRKHFDEAYPGQTRTSTFSNVEWADAGYDDVAEIGELMGLKGL